MSDSPGLLQKKAEHPNGSAAVHAVLESETFQKAPALRALLSYLWEHRDEDLNEFRIAVDALGKRPDYNPKTDSTVRVQILRVRQKLKEYYEREGQQSHARLTLPVGSHRLSLESAETESAARRPVPAWLPWALAGFFALTTVAAVVAWPRGGPLGFKAPPLDPFWRSFTANGKPVRIIVPNVAFFRWPDNTIKVRDTRVNSFEEIPASPDLRRFVQEWGRPELMINYTSAPDAFAAAEMTAYLARSGVTVSVVGHRQAALDPAGAYNRILVGNAQSSPHILPLLADRNFEPLNGFSFRNRNPGPGERSVVPMVIESRHRETVPGLICRLRGGNAETLVLLSENTVSLARLLTTGSGLASVEKLLGRSTLTGPFELLSVSIVEGGRVARTTPEAFRRILAHD
jgi:hypothetical protein